MGVLLRLVIVTVIVEGARVVLGLLVPSRSTSGSCRAQGT